MPNYVPKHHTGSVAPIQSSCWSEPNFDPATNASGRGDDDGRIVPAAPFGDVSAIKALSAYIRSKGMKFGIYGAAGQTTCASRVGSLYVAHASVIALIDDR